MRKSNARDKRDLLRQHILSGRLPSVVIAATTLGAIAISIACLSFGYFIIFQNLFYIPIIIACICYTKRGFVFSLAIAGIYFCLILTFTRESTILWQAFVRSLIFVLIAGIITFLSSGRKRAEEIARKQNDDFEGAVHGRTMQLEGDFAALKQAQEALNDSEMRYRRLFETAQDGIVILDAATGMILDINPFLVGLLGYSHEQFCGKRIWEIGFLKDIVENKDNFLKLQQEKYVRYEDLPLETADGRMIDVEFVSNVYRVDHHEVIQCNIRDITARKQVERELSKVKDVQFKTLMDLLPSKVFLKDRNSVYLSCNENYAKDLKIKSEEIAGKTDFDFFPTQLAEKYRADDRRIMKTGKTESWDEEYHVIKDYLEGSQTSYIHIVKAPVRDKTGNVTGLFGLFWDITEQRKLQAEKNRVEVLASSAEEKSRFASMVSHELRSPLAVIKEALDIVLDGVVGSVSDQQKNILDMAKSNTDRLGRLINNVLDFQKIESGKMTYDIQENDINDLALEIYKGMNLLGKRKRFDLRVELEEGLPKMNFDRDKIAQVVMNLMSNAIKNTKAGSVTLVTRKENNAVHISVQDTGVGIPAQDLKKLFHAFEQVSNPQGKSKGGTGLGLAISREIVLAHHGKIWVESEVGKGSTFHFTLPL
ncbi:MAG: ATP-binding protein [Candidatus Omnitrophica bacterium]|nr:ATP-binding protein [Candidatus Omnitrophota bacterium]